MRARVKELEDEVKSLKTKLDELRKAKNTTLIKKEKEFVTTGISQRSSHEVLDSGAAQKAIEKKYQAEIERVGKPPVLSF